MLARRIAERVPLDVATLLADDEVAPQCNRADWVTQEPRVPSRSVRASVPLADRVSEVDDLVHRADLDGLVRLVDKFCSNADWATLLELRTRSRATVVTGRQLWPVATLAEYRLALWAPDECAASVLDEESGMFTIGPLTEVVAQNHQFVDLRSRLRRTAPRVHRPRMPTARSADTGRHRQPARHPLRPAALGTGSMRGRVHRRRHDRARTAAAAIRRRRRRSPAGGGEVRRRSGGRARRAPADRAVDHLVERSAPRSSPSKARPARRRDGAGCHRRPVVADERRRWR